MGFLAVRGMIDGIAGVAQRHLQLARQVDIILDEQNTHDRSPKAQPPASTEMSMTRPSRSKRNTWLLPRWPI